MISFSFNLRNPFSERWGCIKCLSGQISKNKYWEVQFDKNSDILSFELRYSIRQDHAGLFVSFGLFGYDVIAHIYDSRHWNDEEGRFYNYNDKGEAT